MPSETKLNPHPSGPAKKEISFTYEHLNNSNFSL